MALFLSHSRQHSGEEADVASEAQPGRFGNEPFSGRSQRHIPQAEQMQRQKKRGSLQWSPVPLLSIPSPASLTPVIVSGQSGETANNCCLSDEQLQQLVHFLVWLHRHPLVEESVTEGSCTPDHLEGLDESDAASLGCEGDIHLSEVQLKALRRKCERRNRCDSGSDVASEPRTPEFGGCPRFVEDLSLSGEQLEELVLYYHWYEDAFTNASSGRDSDFGLSAKKLHKLRMICEDVVTSVAPMGSPMKDSQTHFCESGLSDVQLQSLVCFGIWHRSRVSAISSVAEPGNEFGLSRDQVGEIKKYYGWCQSRRKFSIARTPNNGLSEMQLAPHQERQDNPPVQSIHCKLPDSLLQYHFPITDEQLQDLVCLFIWCTVASDGFDMDGCDDDLDLPPKQLEQLKRKCGEAEGQGSLVLADNLELASLAEDICIVKEQLQTLMQYCSWMCTPEAKCFTLPAAQLREIRTGCEAQGLTCSWTSLHEGMSKDCNVSDERLQNLMQFYIWRCSILGCIELDEFGLPDKDAVELIRYLSWCENRAKAMGRTSESNPDMGCGRQETVASLMPETSATEALSISSAGVFPIEECCPIYEQLVPERLSTTDASGEDDAFLSEETDNDCQPMNPLAIGGNGDAEVPGQPAHTGAALGTQLECWSPASNSSEVNVCIPTFSLDTPAVQPVGTSLTPEAIPEPSDPTTDPSVEALATSAENASKVLDTPPDTPRELENFFDFLRSAPAVNLLETQGACFSTSCLPEPVVLRQRRSPAFFSMCSEDSDDSTDKIPNERACGDAAFNSSVSVEVDVSSKQDFSSAHHMGGLADTVMKEMPVSDLWARRRAHTCSTAPLSPLPNLELPLLGRSHCLTVSGSLNAAHPQVKDVSNPAMAGPCGPSPPHRSPCMTVFGTRSAAHPRVEDGSNPAVGGPSGPSPPNWSKLQQRLDCLSSARAAQLAGNNPSSLLGEQGVAAGSLGLRSEAKKITGGSILDGCNRPSRVSELSLDDFCSDDAPPLTSVYTVTRVLASHARTSPLPSAKAKTFCCASKPAEFWGCCGPASLQDDEDASSTWWPSQIFDGLTKMSYTEIDLDNVCVESI